MKYQVMEFNDNFTRNRIISMIKPFLGSVQAGRGIQDFLVICDESNNTPDVISRNQLVVDVFIKPTYVAGNDSVTLLEIIRKINLSNCWNTLRAQI